MSLHSWQIALIKMLPDPDNTEQILNRQVRDLTDSERANLTALQYDRGLDVTRDVLQWWRLARLQVAIPFSMRLIKRLGLSDLLERYELQPCKTLFFVREAQQFQRFLSRMHSAPTLLMDLVRFECALHSAKLQRGQTQQPGSSVYIETLSLTYNPELCILSLLNDTSLPDPEPGGIIIQVSSAERRCWSVMPRQEGAVESERKHNIVNA